jgi:hypothetical protein
MRRRETQATNPVSFFMGEPILMLPLAKSSSTCRSLSNVTDVILSVSNDDRGASQRKKYRRAQITQRVHITPRLLCYIRLYHGSPFTSVPRFVAEFVVKNCCSGKRVLQLIFEKLCQQPSHCLIRQCFFMGLCLFQRCWVYNGCIVPDISYMYGMDLCFNPATRRRV